jgi:PAS domain S-box-containing protein
LLEAAPQAVVVVGDGGRIQMVNARALTLFGYGRRELVGSAASVLGPPGTATSGGPVVTGAADEPGPDQCSAEPDRPQVELRRADGTRFPAQIAQTAVSTPVGGYTVIRIRELTGTAPAARPKTLLASIVQSSHDSIVSTGLDGTVLTWNSGAERLYGYRAEEIVGRSGELVIPPERRPDEREIIALVRAGGRLDRYRTQRLRKDGRIIAVSLTVSPVTDPATGAIVAVASIARDMSRRERAEAQVQAVIEAAPDALIGVGEDDRIEFVNSQAEQAFDYVRYRLLGQSGRLLLPDGLPCGETDRGPIPVMARRSDGTQFPAEVTCSELTTDDGPVICAAIRDITERLEAQAEQVRLQAEAERERMEAQLHRSQRLESLGQLAGGVAHDFNNLLAVILNYAAFVIEESGSPDADLGAIGRDGEQIRRAAERGSELTHQLLAFARREVIRPRVLDINRVITDVEQLLRRSLGEQVTLVTRPGADLPAIKADPGQIEQVLVNLAVNARDAMPGGGRLTIETSAVEIDDDYHHPNAPERAAPGCYARIRVADSGTGMAREVIERAFEPFYTTKPSGEGTGLGLATVYGIITQAGGTVHIYSEPGTGTTITVLLPATDEQPAAAGRPPEPEHGLSSGETILLVEDEDELRAVTQRILESAAYQVLTASSGDEAVKLLAGYDLPIHLLLTDVIMPGMLGKELAERFNDARPGIPVLYMSGYAQPMLATHNTLDPNVVLLEKPFGRRELLAEVRKRLA